jgi:hypothetical protein
MISADLDHPQVIAAHKPCFSFFSGSPNARLLELIDGDVLPEEFGGTSTREMRHVVVWAPPKRASSWF